jgi:UDP-sulfoquinovose synthase
MKVLIAGIDGYIGWALAYRLHERGHTVFGIDNLQRRRNVELMKSCSAIPILVAHERQQRAPFEVQHMDLCDIHRSGIGKEMIEEADAVVDLAEQPSAAWSMRGVEELLATNANNTGGTLALLWAMRRSPETHLVKLGTMGEYGTPNIEITEGPIEVEFRGRSDRLPFPKQPGSMYHASKCADSLYVQLACKCWGLRSTDVMQGVVYGSRGEWDAPDPLRQTRVDTDEAFGTVVHRFCAQAVAGLPLTVYGAGGQTRGYLPLRDSLTCLTLAIENPPEAGEYRIFNQFDRCYSVAHIAQAVIEAAGMLGLDARAESVPNPRIELEEHFYEPESVALQRLGYEPTGTLGGDVRQIMEDMLPHREALNTRLRRPEIRWAL